MNEIKQKNSVTKLKQPILPFIILLSVLILGTLSYYILWEDTGGTFIDALYMTIITITTVGFMEVHPLDSIGRLLTIFISLLGIGSLFYILMVIMENLFIIQLQNIRGKKKMQKKIEMLENHIILVGFGRVGKLTAAELSNQQIDFVVIDEKFDELTNDKFNNKFLTVTGDAAEDNVLKKAGIERASGIIVTTANPATTVFVVLTAKVLNPNIFIVARADEDNDVQKLIRAGADRIVNPYQIGGQRLANLMIKPNVIDFFETSFGSKEFNLTIENMELPADSPLIAKTLSETEIRKNSGATILAIVRNDKPYINPDADFILQCNDQLVSFGSREQLKKLEMMVIGKK